MYINTRRMQGGDLREGRQKPVAPMDSQTKILADEQTNGQT